MRTTSSGRYKPDTIPSGSRFSDVGRQGVQYKGRYFHDEGFAAIQAISEAGTRTALHHAGVACFVCGQAGGTRPWPLPAGYCCLRQALAHRPGP
jgi:hypothetical protein|eukprot:COSAG01_NODE_4721_length_4792_cov_6.484551_2_plen_94_part_00